MSWSTLFDPSTSSRLCLTLLHSIWQVSLLVAAAWITERLLRSRTAERSYALHVGALGASLALLPLTYAVVQVPKLPAIATVSAGDTSPSASILGEEQRLSSIEAPSFPVSTANSSVASSNLSPATPPAWWKAILDASPWVAGVYVAGVLLMVGRLIRSVIASERLRRRATPIEFGPLADFLRRLSAKWSLRVTPVLAKAEHLLTPKVIGLLRPTILLPASTLAGMSARELELILIHELAHVRRHDMWINLVQRLAEAVLFFNPSLWYLSRRIATLREYCCDELTCEDAMSGNAAGRISYASALLRVVEISKPSLTASGELTALAAAGRSPSELRRRVSRLLGEPLREPPPMSRGGFSMLAVAALLLVVGPTVFSRAGAPSNEQSAAPHDATAEIRHIEAEKFSSGARAEVLALGTHGEGPQRWWDATGEPIDPVPFIWKEAGTVTAPDSQWRRLVFRMKELPDDADVTWKIVGATSSAGGEVSLDAAGNERPKGYYTRYFSVPREATQIGLRIGMAHGPWRTVARVISGPFSMGMADKKSIVFSDTFDTADGAVVVVSHNYFDQNYRVVAIDKGGKTFTSSHSGGMSAGAISQTRPTFPGLSSSEIDRFEFQVRDYEWVEFKELQLNPKNDAKGGASQSRADDKSMTVYVVDSRGGPISGAKVFQNHVHSLEPGGRHLIKNHRYVTDADGKVVITWNGDSIDLRVWASKDRYVPLHAMWAKAFQSDGDLLPDEFRFILQAGTEIGGIVLDEAGRPVKGARIEIQDATAFVPEPVGRPGRRPVPVNWLAEGDTALVTNAEGRWTAVNVPHDDALVFESQHVASQIRTPLILRISHPDFATFDGWKSPRIAPSPSIESLRQKDAVIELRKATASANDEKADNDSLDEWQ